MFPTNTHPSPGHDVIRLLRLVQESGGVAVAEWRARAAECGVDGDALLRERALVHVVGTDVLLRTGGRELLRATRAETVKTGGAARIWSRRTIVTDHAVDRALARYRFAREWDDARRQIRREVTQALQCGRFANHKPTWWPLLYGEKSRGLAPGQVFAWNEGRNRGWIVSRETDGRDVVLTSLHRVAAPPANAAEQS